MRVSVLCLRGLEGARKEETGDGRDLSTWGVWSSWVVCGSRAPKHTSRGKFERRFRQRTKVGRSVLPITAPSSNVQSSMPVEHAQSSTADHHTPPHKFLPSVVHLHSRDNRYTPRPKQHCGSAMVSRRRRRARVTHVVEGAMVAARFGLTDGEEDL